MGVERAAGGASLIRPGSRSIDTYFKYSEAAGQLVPVVWPALESRCYDELAAENQALRAELSGARQTVARRRRPGV